MKNTRQMTVYFPENKTGRLPMPSVSIPPKQTVEVRARSSVIFRGLNLISSHPRTCLVMRFEIAGRGDPPTYPIDLNGLDGERVFDCCRAGEEILLQVLNISDESIEWSARMEGETLR